MAVGLDTEVAGAAKERLWPGICAPAELTWLDALPRAERAAAVTLIFSAKEAFYKCQYPLTGDWLNFHDLVVVPQEWQAARGRFDVNPARPIKLFDGATSVLRSAVHGSYRFHEEFVSAGVCVIAHKPSGQGG